MDQNETNHKHFGEILRYRAKIFALEQREHEAMQIVETLDMKIYLLREQLNNKNNEIIMLQKKIYRHKV